MTARMKDTLNGLMEPKVWAPQLVALVVIIFTVGSYKQSLDMTLRQYEKEISLNQSAMEKVQADIKLQDKMGTESERRYQEISTMQIKAINERLIAYERRMEALDLVLSTVRSEVIATRTDVEWIRRKIERSSQSSTGSEHPQASAK